VKSNEKYNQSKKEEKPRKEKNRLRENKYPEKVSSKDSLIAIRKEKSLEIL
jgi:hypothetical protein